MFWKLTIPTILLGVVLALAGCAPAAAPTATPTKPPQVAPTKAAESTKPPSPPPSPAPSAVPTPKPASLKFGAAPNAADAGVYVAIEKGYFREQGITLEFVEFRSNPEIIAPLSTGQVDVGALSLSPAILAAVDRGIDLKIVADKGNNQPRFDVGYIVLRKDLADSGQVKTAADLKGMKIATPSLGSVAEQTIELMMNEAGLTIKDVDLVVLPFDQMVAAFANKAVAASFEVEPFTARGVQDGLFVRWKPSSSLFGGKLQSTAIVFSPTLAGNKELGQRWMVGYVKGVRDYRKALTAGEGWDDVVSILTKYTAVKDPKLYKAMELPSLDPNGALDKRSVDLQYKWFLQRGLYTGKKTFDDIIDASYAEYAVQRLGRQ